MRLSLLRLHRRLLLRHPQLVRLDRAALPRACSTNAVLRLRDDVRLSPDAMSDDRLFDPDTRPRHQRSDPGAVTAGKARHDGSDTMRASARRVMPRTGTQRRTVLEEIALAYGFGCTDEEICHFTAMNANTERPRRVELVEGNWIVDSTLRRPTSSGAQAIVWVLADDARAEWEASR